MSDTIKTNGAAMMRGSLSENDQPDTVPAHPPKVWTERERRASKPSAGAEPYDGLLWRLQARQAAGLSGATTLGLTSCERRAGVSTVAANLALRAAELQLGPVLLIEAAPARSWLSKTWNLAPGPGLTQLLAGEASYNDCLRPGPAPQLEVMPLGQGGRNEVGVIEMGSVEALMAEACSDHRLVIFDLPRADQLNHMLLVAKQLDQVLLVLRAESTRKADAERLSDQLLDDGVPLAGVVLNRRKNYVPRWLRRWF